MQPPWLSAHIRRIALLIAVVMIVGAVVIGHGRDLLDPSSLGLLAIGFCLGVATNRRLW